ncbi:MAG: SLBB domain-containing protein, partial [Candidatus Acidiferrum sp.]
AKENFDRVAASAAQIRSVLAKDPGILVELKRWIAKEATDNGQIVEDSMLADDAVFDRLDRDVAFRSMATRLVQRYGYLMPAPNPDSTMGKEQELILKERARRIVQIESQEDSELTRPSKNDHTYAERTTECAETNGGEGCLQRRNSGPRRDTSVPNNNNNEIPQPPANLQEFPEAVPQQRGAQIIQTAEVNPDLGMNPGTVTRRAGPDSYLNPEGLSGEGSINGAPPRGSAGLGGGTPQIFGSNAAPNLGSTGAPSAKGEDVVSRRNRGWWERESRNEEEFAPPTMVRSANPFSDVPSLYEMYMQAAPQQKLQRFGLDVFRNDSRLTDAVPMDLPVGPDYVVGPGDGLAVDIWGGISQRLTRVVDRAGRIALPEAGPILVSGKTLGEVQSAVQQALRSEFLGVSADVSLARLRTVRIYVVGDVKDPGAYDISSLSTPLNAIYAAGGVTARGSLRSLKHFHGKTLVQEVDAYDLLLHGVQTDLKHLENGDSLLVSPLGPEVTVDGMVRRPSNYELNDEKNLADVVELAGGILPTGTMSHIEVQRIEAHQKRTMVSFDVAPTENKESITAKLREFQIADGDQVHVFPIANYNEDAIFLQGHVIRSGRYSYTKGMKLTDLVASYKDLLPEPAGHYADRITIHR